MTLLDLIVLIIALLIIAFLRAPAIITLLLACAAMAVFRVAKGERVP